MDVDLKGLRRTVRSPMVAGWR